MKSLSISQELSPHNYPKDISYLLDPRNEYDYPEFETMLGYARDFIQKQTLEQGVDINFLKNYPNWSSYVLRVWDEEIKVPKTPLQIFCFLSRFEWEILSADQIISYWLWTHKVERGILDSNISSQIVYWNQMVSSITNLQIPLPQKLWLWHLWWFFVGELKSRELLSHKSWIKILNKGNTLSLYTHWDHHIGEVTLKWKERDILKFFLKKQWTDILNELLDSVIGNTTNIKNIRQLCICRLRKALKPYDRYIKIITIRWFWYRLEIYPPKNDDSINDQINTVLDME